MQKFEQNIDINQQYLKMFALKLTKDNDAAADLYQETVYRALKNKDKFVHGSNIRAWLTTIMKNSFINHYRRKKKMVSSPNGDVHSFIIETNSSCARNDGESSVTADELHKIINHLDEDLKVPFLMMWQGYKYEEVSDQLNIPLGTVKSRIFQARKLLQDKVKRLFSITHREALSI